MDVDIITEIATIIMESIGGTFDKFKFVVEDFSVVASNIRELEVYLGVPFSFIHYLISIYKPKRKKNATFLDKATLLFRELMGEVDFTAKNLTIPEQLRYIGYLLIIGHQFDERDEYILQNFKSTLKEEVILSLTWDFDDPIFEEPIPVLDIHRRWNKQGNLPISVFAVLCASIPSLHKMASFIRHRNGLMFNKTAIDEIYFLNALHCVNNIKMLEFRKYLSLI